MYECTMHVHCRIVPNHRHEVDNRWKSNIEVVSFLNIGKLAFRW